MISAIRRLGFDVHTVTVVQAQRSRCHRVLQHLTTEYDFHSLELLQVGVAG